MIAQSGPLQRLVFGEYDGRRSERVETFHRACKQGGINAEISDDVRRSIWEKYVVLVAMSGATTAMRRTIGPIRSHPLTRAFLIDLASEVVAVGRALGVALPADFVEQRIPFFDGWPPEMTTSMHHDLQNGRPLEVRWLSGGVVDLGEQAGVPTPMNRAVRDILILHSQGHDQSTPPVTGVTPSCPANGPASSRPDDRLRRGHPVFRGWAIARERCLSPRLVVTG